MRLKTVVLLLFVMTWQVAHVHSQETLDSSPPEESTELTDRERDTRELLELRSRLRDIESMLLAQKDRENELLRDLNRMILASQEEPEESAAEQAKKEIEGVEQRFEEESAVLQAKIQQLEVALAAGQERDLLMGQQMNKTILVTVSTVAGIGLLVFLVTVYLQYRLISRPIQPVYMTSQPLTLESEGGAPRSPEKRKTEANLDTQTGLVENSKVKDTNEKYVSAVERLEARIREMEAGLSRADEVLGSVESQSQDVSPEEAATETSDAFPEEVVSEEVVSESEAIILEPTEESVENTVDFAKIADEMDVNVLEEEGKRFLQKEDWSTALKYFDQLVQLDGERVDNWVNRGRALEMLGREGEAIESYDYAIQANPDLPSPFLYKAALLSRLERFEEAQQFYNAALSKVPVQKSKPAKVAG